jgi:5,10-methylenetetrahydromethanopterin reductase
MALWRHAFAFCGQVAPLARRCEEVGYDGLMVADSQNLNADVWVELGLAAATQRILLGPGVTNPATRHPAVTASAAATLQVESGGRAVLEWAGATPPRLSWAASPSPSTSSSGRCARSRVS